ncbi:hypothetical protein pb186bvf_017503 [Paramecium bursaria]
MIIIFINESINVSIYTKIVFLNNSYIQFTQDCYRFQQEFSLNSILDNIIIWQFAQECLVQQLFVIRFLILSHLSCSLEIFIKPSLKINKNIMQLYSRIDNIQFILNYQEYFIVSQSFQWIHISQIL